MRGISEVNACGDAQQIIEKKIPKTTEKKTLLRCPEKQAPEKRSVPESYGLPLDRASLGPLHSTKFGKVKGTASFGLFIIFFFRRQNKESSRSEDKGYL